MLIKMENGKMKVQSDYNRKFIAKARELQGKWEPPFWVFPEENEELVRDALMEAYGEDGRVHEMVVVDIHLDEYRSKGDDLMIGSVVLAKRFSRDSRVVLHKNAVVIAGGFCSSGGSRNSPSVTYEEGTILRVKDVPVSLYEQIQDMPGVVKVDLDANHKEKKAALEREKETLLNRLAEIEKLLTSL